MDVKIKLLKALATTNTTHFPPQKNNRAIYMMKNKTLLK